MKNRATTYPFNEDEMYGFAEKKIRTMLESKDTGRLAKLFK